MVMLVVENDFSVSSLSEIEKERECLKIFLQLRIYFTWDFDNVMYSPAVLIPEKRSFTLSRWNSGPNSCTILNLVVEPV